MSSRQFDRDFKTLGYIIAIVLVIMLAAIVVEAHIKYTEHTKQADAITKNLSDFCEKQPNGVIASRAIVIACDSSKAEGSYRIQD